MTHILVTLPVQDRHRAMLHEAMPEGNFSYVPSSNLTPGDLRPAHIILGSIPRSLLPHAQNLRWMQLGSAGTDGFYNAMPPGAVLTNSSGAYGLAIAEHMLAMLLSLQKRLHQYRVHQMNHNWADEGEVRSIEGSTTLVVGVGDIGGEFARRMRALGSRVLGVRRTGTETPPGVDELYHLDALDGLLHRADIVALCLPGTSNTQGMFDRERLARMKKGAILLNIGRGSVICTDALCDALDSGHLGGAGLDVTDPEPLPPGHRLWDTPNALITPHISGGYHLQQTFERIVGICAENLAAFRNGQPLRNVVDVNTGYRTL